MLAHEIIQLSRIPDTNFRSLVQQALNHALWDYVLLFDKEGDIETQLPCLVKESLSKLLFRFFCLQNNLPIDFNSNNSERFLSFKHDQNNWELISISIEGPPITKKSETLLFPAMIPSLKLDCTQKDEFGNKIIQWTSPINKQALFVYLHNNSADKSFVELNLPEGLKKLYSDFFTRKNKGQALKESDFWKKLKPLGTPDFLIHHTPDFYITAWAGSDHWKFFYTHNSLAFPYIKTFSEENKAVMMHRLPAFCRLFPQLNDTLHFAKFLN